ncbi:MAG TPA: CBS domain-containing protein [Alphaproteobacteria bacterium]|nr:CBS domain-containing protein [Alphaproteobacteria bacterium]
MKIADILRRKGGHLITVRPDDTVAMAVGVMTAKGIGALLVCELGGQFLGLLSERDVVQAIARQRDNVATLRVDDVMTRDVVVCTPADSVKHMMAVITNRRARHVPVLEDGKLVGIVSVGDVLKSRLDEAVEEANVLRDLSMATRG